MLCLRTLTRSKVRLTNRVLPSFIGSSVVYNGLGIRGYTSHTAGKKREDAPSFKKIFLVAILGTLVFMQAANSLDKNKPKTSYSEEEFENVMSGLKRRVSLFPAGTLSVKLIPKSSDNILTKVRKGSELVIEPEKVVEYYRCQKDGSYQALLDELKATHGADYFEKLPHGMLVMLIGKYMKEQCQTNSEVIITNFPQSIKDAIKFENDICTVTSIITDKENSNSDVCQYYQTVQKVEQV